MPVVLGVASAITSRRVATYGLASTVAAVAIVFNAFRQRSNFYSAAVMLGGSNGCMMVLFNFGIFLTLCAGKVAQKIFFGPLRAVEVERLHERLWYAITESLLAMTIFRDDFDGSFAMLFGTMLFLKVFHWLARDRVEFMEQSPTVTRLFHVRMIAVLSLLFEFDLFFATFAIEVLLVDQNRKGIMIMFASEFFILTATLWATIAKYLINCQDMRSEEPWEAKSMYVFFVDLATDFLKLITYLGCFALILSYYGLPLNIIRDVYMTGRSFFGRLRDFIKYRAATRNMDTRFPDATSTDLSSMSDGTCIICREEMVARGASQENDPSGEAQSAAASGLNETPKKLPCGHIFHFHCLRSWLERQQSCPTCRRTVFTSPDAAQAGVPQANQLPPNAGVNAAAAQPNAGAPRPPNAAGNRTTAQIAQAAQDRMQSLLQQLETGTQRLRTQNGDIAQTANGAPASQAHNSSTTRSPAQDSESTLEQRRKRMIASVFGDHRDLEGHTRHRPNSASSSLLSSSRSGRDTQLSSDKRLLRHIPTAPWTLHAALRSAQPRRSGSNNGRGTASTSTSEDRASAPAPIVEAEMPSAPAVALPEAPADPADAREAARLAALRRFQKERGSDTSERGKGKSKQASDSLQRSEEASSVPESRTPQAALPGNPVLIPLFQTELIHDFDDTVASRLPFPLADRRHGQGLMQTANGGSSGSSASLSGPAGPHEPNTRSVASLEAISPLSLSATDMTQLATQTRQGLEARLQLLHRVEGSIHGLIDDLTRALSVIPAHDVGVAATESIQPEPAASPLSLSPTEAAQSQAEMMSSASTGGKGKAPAEGVHAPERSTTDDVADVLDGV